METSLPTSNKTFLTLEDAVFFLGISKSTLYKLTSNRKVPFYQPFGRKILFEKSELDSWIKSKRRATIQELESQPLSLTTKKKGGGE